MSTGAARLRRAATLVQLDTTTIRASVVGDGPPVLLCSGLSSSLESWGPLVDRLPAYRFITFDVPGVGESPDRCPPVRIGQVAALATRLLDHLAIEHAHVVGYSWGGAVAQHLGWRSRHRVDRLVLASTSVGVGSVPGVPWPVGSAFGSAAGGARPATTWAGLVGQVGAIATWSSLPWMRRIEAPTLVLAGADDPLVPPLNAHVLGWGIPRAEVVVLRGLGHPLFAGHALSAVAPRIHAFLGASA